MRFLRKLKKFFWFIIIFSIPAYAKNLILHYDPMTVELPGILDLQSFPGLPNYESIANGDKIERHFYLKLDKPVDVLTRKEDSDQNAENERSVRIVQLAIDAEDNSLWARFRRAGRGTHVIVTGQLFHRLTGHHHSRVLLSVEQLKE